MPAICSGSRSHQWNGPVIGLLPPTNSLAEKKRFIRWCEAHVDEQRLPSAPRLCSVTSGRCCQRRRKIDPLAAFEIDPLGWSFVGLVGCGDAAHATPLLRSLRARRTSILRDGRAVRRRRVLRLLGDSGLVPVATAATASAGINPSNIANVNPNAALPCRTLSTRGNDPSTIASPDAT